MVLTIKLTALMDEAELISGIQREDQVVLKFCYKAYYRSVHQLVVNNSGSEEDAKDIYQEAFMILVEHINSGHFKGLATVKTYLYSVSRRLWLNELRIRRRHIKVISETEPFIEPEEVLFEQAATNRQKTESLTKSLNLLGEPCTSVLRDYYVNGLSMAEIASKQGYTNEANAKNQKYKCLQRLKKIFFSMHEEG